MRYLTNLPQFNARYKVPANWDAYIAVRIGIWSRSGFYAVIAASLILATCAPAPASAYDFEGPNGPATTARPSSGRKAVGRRRNKIPARPAISTKIAKNRLRRDRMPRTVP